MEASLQIVPFAANGFALEIPISRFSLFPATLALPLRKGCASPHRLSPLSSPPTSPPSAPSPTIVPRPGAPPRLSPI